MILPLILILILIHIYFGRYRSEQLGWSSAFGNSISLLWISVILFKFLFDTYTFQELISNQQGKLIITTILTLWVMLLFTFNFFHTLPKKLAFIVSSASSIYILAYIVISLVVGNLPFTRSYFFSSAILFIILLILIQLIKYNIPMSTQTKQVLKQQEKKKIAEKAKKRAARRLKWKNRIMSLKIFFKKIFKRK